MEKEFISYTNESTPNTKKSYRLPYHSKNKTFDFRSSKNSYTRTRNSSDPSDSTSTLIDNPNISSSLNFFKLRLSLKSMYDFDPKNKLRQIFSSSYRPPKAFPRPKPLISSPRKKRFNLDSIFEQKEAELIRDELNRIQSPKVWKQVIQNFKQSPGILMDLIPLE
jgi:hypothetical protein